MKILKEILKDVNVRSLRGPDSISVHDIQIDSRAVVTNSCFIAIRGLMADGHVYIDNAIRKGASVVVCDTLPGVLNPSVTYVEVDNTSIAAGVMAHHFYGDVTGKLKLVGVTGTNGKTTVATLLFRLFSSLGFHCGLIGTVQNQIGETVLPADRTTPDQVMLNKLISEMYDAGCSYVFMEVSSHALHQHRVAGLQFAGGIFTNLTHDHLDYHKTIEAYARAKKMLFDSLPSTAFALTNVDDRRGMFMLQNCAAKKFAYSLKTMADFKGRIIDNSLLGLHMTVNEKEVHFRLIGAFNAYNLLAVYGTAVCLGQDKDDVLEKLSTLKGAEGRFDYHVSEKDRIIAIVDYAHTPDALLNVLATIRNLRAGDSKIITVVGCGGDRDKTKRPEMSAVACEYSDRVFLTSDNPRFEEPEQIIRDMEAGIPVSARRKCISITDRREAIKAAIAFAMPGDILLVAGKGHEKYQEIKGVKNHFDDKEVLAEMFQLLNK